MLRASDADRQQVISALERHTAQGRLTLDEFSDRVGQVLAAATFADLAQVTRDLPAEPAPVAQPEAQRQLFLAFLIAAIAVLLLGAVLALTR
jgi:RNA polymerase-interacting CarD/CdnL/TRCF family regulator